jgi:putative hemolysin
VKPIAFSTRSAHGVQDVAGRASTEAGVAPPCVRMQAPDQASAVAGELQAEAFGVFAAQGRREIVPMPQAVRASPAA